MAARFVSRKDESVRLFKSDALEFWSRVHFSVPLILYVPVTGWLLYTAWTGGALSGWAIAGLYVAGGLAWTLTEYLIHRFAFHFEPRSALGKRLFYLFHGIHHDYPNDSMRLVMPPAVSIPLAFLFYGGFRLLLGKPVVDPFFAGFLTGYLAYDMLHYAIHHAPWKTGIGLYLRQHHFRHHFQDAESGFGVSSPLWDVVFRTMPAGAPERTAVESPTGPGVGTGPGPAGE
jgi:sterol desaturase/sphingolipid hydroxylase (fatty acid hydroxylase superfamily)